MSNIKREKNDDEIMDRIDYQLKCQKKYKRDLMKYLNLNESIYTKWRYDNVKSYMKYIVKIAEFLGVSTDYLISGNINENGVMKLNQDEIVLVTKFRLLDNESKKSFIHLIQKICD